MPLVEGAFVRTLFPTHERPREPGLLHICYCLGVAGPLTIVAYTSTQPWPDGVPTPTGVRVFNAAAAAALNQRAFVLYLNRLAKLPITQRWFPDLATPTQGIVAIAGQRLRDEILDISTTLARRRRETLRLLGP